VSADIARGDGKDFSTFHVIDINESEQVCEFRGKIPPDQFGILLSDIGYRYNKALVCPENNTYGFSTITKLRDIGYPNIYLNDKRFQYASEIPAAKFGFTTSGHSRSSALTKLEEHLRTGAVKVYSSRLLDELKTFVWYGDSPRAQKGFNDDLVMALAIGTSLYDPSQAENKKNLSGAYKAMLAGFGVNKNNTKRPPPLIMGNPFTPRSYDPRTMEEENSNQPIPAGISWLYR
jgi:hypothetical protein